MEREHMHREFTSRWLSRCLRAAGAVSREWCGAGPRELGGWDEFLPDFECSVRKAASGAGAGACCAGPNETAACADGYAVVAGNAPCVFTCCRDGHPRHRSGRRSREIPMSVLGGPLKSRYRACSRAAPTNPSIV